MCLHMCSACVMHMYVHECVYVSASVHVCMGVCVYVSSQVKSIRF